MEAKNSMKKKAGRPPKGDKGTGIPEVKISGMDTLGMTPMSNDLFKGGKAAKAKKK